MFKTVSNKRIIPTPIVCESFEVKATSRGYEALVVEDVQENTPTSTYVCVGDFTAKTGATTTKILVNEAISSAQASSWTGLKLGFNSELRVIQSVTFGTAGNAFLTLSTGFSSAPSANDVIFTPRLETRDSGVSITTGYFRVYKNDDSQPMPILQFSSTDSGKLGYIEYKGLGTTITDLWLKQLYNDAYLIQNQEINMLGAGKGIVMVTPDGKKKYRLTVTNTGSTKWTEVTT